METPRLLSQVQSAPPATPANPYQYTPGATIGPGSSYGTQTYNSSTGGQQNIVSYPGGNPNFQEGQGSPGGPNTLFPPMPAPAPQPYNGSTFTPTPAPQPAAVSQDDAFRSMTPRQIKDYLRNPPAAAAPAAATPAPFVMPAAQAPAAQMPAFDGLQSFLDSLISGQF